ncbi:MAG TPA: hypothetical protein VLG50_03350 [Candidatus Saccharimonadales bacterium]|nr:hypothetical protein [Candidatus Saccharimonadales bacterium]
MKYIIKALSVTIFSAGLMHFGAAQASTASSDIWSTAVANAQQIIGSNSTPHTMLYEIVEMRNYIGTQANSDASFRGMVCALRAIRLALTSTDVVQGTTIPLLHNCFVDLDFFTGYFFNVSSNNIPQNISGDWKKNCANLKIALQSFIS